MAELDVRELAAYIQKKYKDKTGKEISPIKLQKTLYFLFAYWGGMVRKSQENPNYVEEDYSEYSEILFDDEIQAWVYGPVIPVIYHETELEQYYNPELFEGKEKLKEFVDDLLQEIFEVSDFALVEIAHKDEFWILNFDSNSEYHNSIISKETIISEYARKY